MRTFLLSFALALLPMLGLAQGPILRNPVTTNAFMNPPQNGWIAIWNTAAGRWSNGVNTASATNDSQPPSTVLTNLSFTSALTNVNPNQFFPASATHLTITNTPKITNIWDYITMKVFGDLFVSTNLNVTNKITAYGLLGIESAGGGGFAISGGGGYSSSQFAGDFALETGVGPGATIQESAVTSQELSTLSGSSGNIQTNLTALQSASNNRIANLNGRGTNTDFFGLIQLTNTVASGPSLQVGGNTHFIDNFTNDAIASLNAVVGAGIFQWNGALNAFAQDLTVGGELAAVSKLRFGGDPLGGPVFETNALGVCCGLTVRQTGAGGAIFEIIDGDMHWYNEQFWYLPQWNLNATWVNLQLGANASHTTNLLEFLNEAPSENAGSVSAFNAAAALIVGALTDTRATSGSIVATNDIYGARVSVRDDPYGAGWNGSTNVPTKNALYDKIETIVAGSGFQASSMVLSNLVGTVANNVTNENTTALQINAGVMSLTPGVLSNVVASGFGAPYIAVSTNSGANNNVTSLVFRTPSVTLSNDSAGIASIHVAASGGAASTNNPVQAIGSAIITNAVLRPYTHLGSTTNVVVDWTGVNLLIVSPSNTFTVVWNNVPSAGSYARNITLEIVNTNAAAGYFPTNGLNNSPVTMLSAPSTNFFTFHFDGTNFWTQSHQILTTGLGDTNVFNVFPVLHSPYLKGTNLVEGNIGFVEQYPTGTGGALTNFTLLVNQAASFVINGSTNVSFRALYGGTIGLTYTFSIEITNGSGANRTLEFSQETNNWVWPYGMTAPTVLTNSERIVIEGKLRGPSNITVTAAYFPWP